ncbi:DNA-binding protein RFX2 [Camelus dromedarius]|uniref:DNA-binding protein RFX2 n=1 Tax=Camelus dromedarius TaxID=9838 RepID=A0A5N4CJL6_CAMDR|nr:DNA-binding protein RFX2 [Camelus dromedarius]
MTKPHYEDDTGAQRAAVETPELAWAESGSRTHDAEATRPQPGLDHSGLLMCQRVLVQAAGSAPKGAQMQPISLPRVQQVPQQVQPVQHVYPPQVQYVEGGDAVYTNGALRTAYAYNPEPQMYAPSSAASYFEAPGGAQVTVAGSSPPGVPSHSMVGITVDVGGSPIVSSAGAYLIHGGMDSTRHSLAHTSRSSPATVCTAEAPGGGRLGPE